MTNSLFIDVRVPPSDVMTCPTLVIFDNGDWTILPAGDCYYEDTGFVTRSCHAVFQLFSEEEFDQDHEGVDIFLELDFSGQIEEPVILIWGDGRLTAGDRFQAEKLVKNDNQKFYNFIPLAEVIDDLEKFITKRGDALFDDDYGDDDFQPLDFDED